MTNTLVEVTGSYFAIDFEVAPLPAFTVSSDSVTEGSSVNLIVTLNPTSTSATNVTYSTADGTASTAAGDYAVGGPTVLGVCPRIRSWRRKPPRNNLLTVIWTLSWSN